MAFVRILVLAAMSLGFTMSLSSCGVAHLLNFKWGKEEKTFKNKGDAMSIFNGSTVQCDGYCPKNVGGLVTYTQTWGGYQVSVCSMTLVSATTILTNRHCLPDDLQYKNMDCKGRIRLKFPAVAGFNQEDHECAYIEALALHYPSDSDSTINQDWAIIHMNSSSSRPYARLNRDGIESGTNVTFYSSFFDIHQPGLTSVGTISQVTCSTEYDGITLFDYLNKFSSIFKASNCSRPLVKGTSGSGMFDKNDRLLGLLSTGYRDDGLDPAVLGSRMIGGTNIACIGYFGTAPLEAGACKRN